MVHSIGRTRASLDLEDHQASIPADCAGDPPPDGGRQAWLVVLSTFLIHFIVSGYPYSFGVFQTHYVQHDFKLNATPSQVSLIGTVGSSSVFCVGIISGRLAEVYGYRTMMILGTILITLGLVLAAFSHDILWMIVNQGFLVGLGSSFLYYPGLAVIPQWWNQRRSLAMGIAVSGSALGSILISTLSYTLLHQFGKQITLLCMAAFCGSILAVAIMLVQVRSTPILNTIDAPVKTPERYRSLTTFFNSLIHFHHFKNPRFVMLLIGLFLNPYGHMSVFYFMPSYIEYLGYYSWWIPVILNIINASSFLGRALTGLIATYLGDINCLLVSFFFQSISCLTLWLWVPTPVGLISFALLFGFVAGGGATLLPTVTAQVCGIHNLASSIGLVYTALSVGNLVGPPLAALLADPTIIPPHQFNSTMTTTTTTTTTLFPSGGYGWMIVYSGVMLFLSFLSILYLKVRVMVALPIFTKS